MHYNVVRTRVYCIFIIRFELCITIFFNLNLVVKTKTLLFALYDLTSVKTLEPNMRTSGCFVCIRWLHQLHADMYNTTEVVFVVGCFSWCIVFRTPPVSPPAESHVISVLVTAKWRSPVRWSLHASFLIVSDISWNLEIICFLCQNRHPGTHGGKLFSLRTHSCQICSQNVSVINGLRPPTSACLVTLQSFLRWQGDDFPVCCPTVWLQLNVTSFLSVSARSTCGLPLSVCLPGFCSCRKV